jgi:catechol 2,3-dioxygenase-like lactoylglutathione lyase family enzyme
MDFLDVRLALQVDAVAEMREFYLDYLGFDETDTANAKDLLGVRIGKTVLRFTTAPLDSKPFYHFALLAPGDRFEAALTWLAERSELLPDPDTGTNVFDFDNWGALGCYCLDPVGNIIEIIAHRGLGESGFGGSFHPGEFVGFSELGLVVPNKRDAASQLTREIDLQVWDGSWTIPRDWSS